MCVWVVCFIFMTWFIHKSLNWLCCLDSLRNIYAVNKERNYYYCWFRSKPLLGHCHMYSKWLARLVKSKRILKKKLLKLRTIDICILNQNVKIHCNVQREKKKYISEMCVHAFRVLLLEKKTRIRNHCQLIQYTSVKREITRFLTQ